MASGSSDNPLLCDGCENTVLSFTVLSEDQEKLTRFLYEHGVLQRTKVCPTCGGSMTLNEEKHAFNCWNRIESVNSSKKKVKIQCKKYVSQYKNTWFESHNLSQQTICRFVAIWMRTLNPAITEVASVHNYGAFIKIPGNRNQGLVHRSQVSKAAVDDVTEILQRGERVWCKVIKLTDDGKIALSMKVVDQGTGVDLDPNGVLMHQDEVKRKSQTGRGGRKVIELEAVLNTTCMKCGTKGHLAKDCFQSRDGKTYELITEEEIADLINVPVQPNTANNSAEKTEKVKKPKKSKKKKKEKKHKKKSKKKRKYSSSSSSSLSESSSDSDSSPPRDHKKRKRDSSKSTHSHKKHKK